jgi:hypothetical protein
MKIEDWDELVAQVGDHGPEKVVYILETDNGSGTVMVTDIKFEDDQIVVMLA